MKGQRDSLPRPVVIKKKKAQESLSVAVLRFEASRIAFPKSDGNREAYACIGNLMHPAIFLTEYIAGHKNITYPRASTVT